MPNEIFPSLAELAEGAGLDCKKLTVGLETDGAKHIRIPDRHRIAVSDGAKVVFWNVPSLAGLFRGVRPPPPDITHYPPEYTPSFFFIESQLLILCHAMGDRTDQEMEEIYSALKRRPDGRSLGVSHDFMWQVTALLLGRYVLSAAEFEGIMDALLGSARRWGLRPVSRNYAAYLRQTFR